MPTDKIHIGDYYDKMDPKVYDEMLRVINFTEPTHIAEKVYKPLEEEGLAVPRDAAIYDMGCGTGLIGELLHKNGFTNIVASDASEVFAKTAGEKPYYKDVKSFYNGMGLDKFAAEYHNRFDVVTISGCLLKGHMPAAAIEDVHCALKVDGHFVTAIRKFLDEPGNDEGYRDKLDELVAAGKMRRVSCTAVKRGFKDGIEMFAEQESHVLVYQKTA